jgi:hypothetical protein
MMRLRLLVPFLAGAGLLLPAGDLDLTLSTASAGIKKAQAETFNTDVAQIRGKSLSLSSDYRPLGVGMAYTFLTHGPWRFRGSVDLQLPGSAPDAIVRYSAPVGLEPHRLEASGKMNWNSINPGLHVVYLPEGWGEFGLGLEQRIGSLEFKADHVLASFPSSPVLDGPQSRKLSLSDTWLTLHMGVVQKFASISFLARLAYSMNLKSAASIGGYGEASFQTLDTELLKLARPSQEVRLSFGTRF